MPSSVNDNEWIAEVLEASLEQVRQKATAFATSVYNYFFAAVPEAKLLFAHTQWQEQQKMLIGALVLMVKNLRKPMMLQSTMQALGARHIRYGAKQEHFAPFSEAVLKSLRQHLESAWTEDIDEAWNRAFARIQEIMIEAGIR